MTEIFKANTQLVQAYGNKGTHKGGTLFAGNGRLGGMNNQEGIPIGNLFCYTFCPTYDANAFNLSAIPIASGTSLHMPLTNLTPPAGRSQYMFPVTLNGYFAIELDIERPLVINSTQPFSVVISGFDIMKEKVTFAGVGTQIAGGSYQLVCLRSFKYLTDIYFTNTSGNQSTMSVIMEKIISFPYMGNSQQSFNLVWGWKVKESGSNDVFSLFYSTTALGNLVSTGGTLLGTNANQFQNGMYFPYIPINQDGRQTNLTATSGGVRPLYSLNGNVGGTNLMFLWDQTEVYTLYFAVNNQYTIPEIYDVYDNALAISQEEYILGLTNYYDETWYANKVG